MSENNAFSEDQEEDFDLRNVFYKYLRYWYWFIITVTICYTGAYLYLKQYTPIYQVNATLFIKDEKLKKQGRDLVEEFSSVAGKQIDNEIQVLHSRSLLGKVVDALNLTVTYWYEGRSRDIELYSESPIKVNLKEQKEYAAYTPFFIKPVSQSQYILLDAKQNSLGQFEYSQLIKSPYGHFRVFRNPDVALSHTPVKIIFISREEMVNSLVGGIQIAPLSNKTSFINLGIEIALPEKGKAILGKLLEEYAFTTLEDKNREATNTLRFIEERLKLVTNELGDVEQDVEQYKREKGITDLSSEASLFLGKVEENDSKLNELDVQSKVLSGVEGYINNSEAGNLAPATLMVNDPILSGYITQYAQLEAERAKISKSVQPGNPLLETVNGQMKNVKQAIRENINNQKVNLELSRNNLRRLNNRLEGSIATIPRKEREFIGIKRQAGIKENLYLLLLQKREETALSYASTVTDSRIVDYPYETGGAIKPNRRKITSMALLIGFLVPLAVIFIKEMLTNTVQSKKEIEHKTGLKVFGEISLKPKNDQSEIVDVSNRSFVSEQIRMIRSNLQYLLPGNNNTGAHVILFTSSTSGEGKSFVTLNVAISLGLLNKKVVVLGLDLRKPKISNYLGVDHKKGISNFLINNANAEEIIQTTTAENVFFIPSGPIPPNPSELISNGRIGELIEILKQQYDYILIDTPPLGLVTDATLLSNYADVCFYIIRHEKTPKQFLSMIPELVRKKTFKSLNIIFNAVNYKNSSEYGYGYGYGYGYYDEGITKNSWLKKILPTK